MHEVVSAVQFGLKQERFHSLDDPHLQVQAETEGAYPLDDARHMLLLRVATIPAVHTNLCNILDAGNQGR